VLVSMLALTTLAGAHDGPHKIMGTVALVQGHRIDVTTTEGKTATVAADEKTRIIRDKTPMTLSDVKPGLRVVITAREKKGTDGKLTLTASEVRLGSATPRVGKPGGI
jgi:phage tail sheath gpL-like